MIRKRGITLEANPRVRYTGLNRQVPMQHFVNAVQAICLVP